MPHSLVCCYLQVADQTAALQVFDELLAQGVQPSRQCYTSLLAACARGGDLHAARRVFRSMHVQPGVAAYTALMDACLKKGTPEALDEAFQVTLHPCLSHQAHRGRLNVRVMLCNRA